MINKIANVYSIDNKTYKTDTKDVIIFKVYYLEVI